MRILHYFLGFPPYRTGGLTKYAFDLMQAQVEDDHIVIALWPGQIGIFNHRVDIKKRDDISGIKNYELINPLPVSLDEGISELEAYMKPCDIATYESFLKDVKPNAIHIHTLMGLHKEFIEAAEKLHIKTVFTTHDYFGICPKVTLYRFGEACQNDHDCRDCIQCNCSALSLKKIMIMQSPLYRGLKNFPIVKQLRKQHRGDFFANELIPEMPDSSDKIAEMAIQYKKLRAYYISMLERIDCIHFNSSVAEAVYKKYMIPKNSVVMTITHKNIVDNRKINEWKPADKFRITSLAPAKPFKGFNVLQTALDELWESGRHDFELKLFSPVKSPRPYMVIKEDGFKQNELSRIFNNTDVLVAPSICYETFGFTVLEAISYGVPVIVSNHVGAKDIVGDDDIVVEAGSVQELKEAIVGFDKARLCRHREDGLNCVQPKTLKYFLGENYKLYRE